MSDITKGEIVEATVAAYGYHVRPNSRGRREAEWVTAGMELEVTAVVGDYLNALGAPGREREFRIPMISEDGLKVTATVTARSRRLAEQRIRERISAAAPLELTGSAS